MRPEKRQSHPLETPPTKAAFLIAACLSVTIPAWAQNDNFTDREILVGGATTAFCNNIGATSEADEPEHQTGTPPNKSVWWEWTAPQDGYFEINTEGSSFDTVLAVYAGTSLPDLENRGRNVDVYTLGDQSRVIFYAEQDEDYTIAVDGENGAAGEITLNLFPALLRNDEFGERIPIAGSSVFDIQSNVGGTTGLYEPNHVPSIGSTASVWWDWTCESDGWVTVDTKGSTFDTVLAVYVRNVILIGNSNDYFGRTEFDDQLHAFDVTDDFNARVRFYGIAGNSYQIAVDGSDGLENGGVHLSVSQSLEHPANDNVSSPAVLVSTTEGDTQTASYTGSTVGASIELGEPDHNPGDETSASTTVWFEWQSPAEDRLVTIDTFDSDFDTILAVYSRQGDTLIRWANNDDDEEAPDFQSAVRFHSQANTTYLITVDGYAGEQGELGLNLVASDQRNDSFEFAVAQHNFSWNSTSNNSQATAEEDEPAHSIGHPAANSLWWRWESEIDGNVEANTFGSDFDTILAVYTGELGDLNLIGSNDDAGGPNSPQSSLQFEVEYGEVYYFAVDGKNGDTGDIALNFSTLGGYENWLSQFPGLLALLDLPQDDPLRSGALPEGDPDADGFSNRLEAAFGLDPETNSQPGGNDPNRGNAPAYSFDGSNVVIDFTLDPIFAVAGDNEDTTRLGVFGERSSNGIIWSSLTPISLGSNRYRVVYPISFGGDFGVFRVTAIDPSP